MPSMKKAGKQRQEVRTSGTTGRRTAERALRNHVVNLLEGRSAHVDFDQAVKGCNPQVRGARPPGAEHSPWQVVEHLRIAQWDILEFSRNPRHVSPEWPAGYWPQSVAPPDDRAWERSLRSFRADLKAMKRLVMDPQRDLLKPFPWGQGQTLLREALLVADHNAYHLGELVLLRRLLGDWKD